MNDNIHGYYLEAGQIAAKVRNDALPKIKEGISLLDIAQFVEGTIKDMGAEPAFPCNISINEIASHYTPQDHQACFRKGDVVKLDIGAHIEGYIADTAATIEVGTQNHNLLIHTCEDALEKAIRYTKDGVETNQIGKVIEDTIKERGFNPIKDLTGHNLEQYQLHAGITIPNYKSFFSHTIKKDMVFAIEPFATYGRGNIKTGKPFIFAIINRCKGIIADDLKGRFGSLPFAPRWAPGTDLDELKGAREYYELIEKDGEIVAQSEHTVIVNEEGCEVITRLGK
ncbi:MAG: type II methionyl aminopeptidase [Candidatus Methanoperedens sp.]|nr:type II methionyl aminopeptidase [Candidatus Methanoperedens sp.]CAG0953253.1 methionyl aminopeptidase [Methanosarcinales archaeon]